MQIKEAWKLFHVVFRVVCKAHEDQGKNVYKELAKLPNMKVDVNTIRSVLLEATQQIDEEFLNATTPLSDWIYVFSIDDKKRVTWETSYEWDNVGIKNAKDKVEELEKKGKGAYYVIGALPQCGLFY